MRGYGDLKFSRYSKIGIWNLFQGIKYIHEAVKKFNGSLMTIMKDVCKNVNVTINDVSDLNRCLEIVVFKENDIIDGLEKYTSTTSRLVQFSVQWKHFIHPSKLSSISHLQYMKLS